MKTKLKIQQALSMFDEHYELTCSKGTHLKKPPISFRICMLEEGIEVYQDDDNGKVRLTIEFPEEEKKNLNIDLF